MFILDEFGDSRISFIQESRGARKHLVDLGMELVASSDTEGSLVRDDQVRSDVVVVGQ